MEKKGYLNNTKGSLNDVVMIMVTIFAFSLIVLIAFKVSDSINSQIQTSGVISQFDTDNNARNAMSQVNNMFPTTIDNSFLLLTIGLCLVALILAMLVAVHPVFFVFYFIFLTITIFVSGALSNVYQTMALEPSFASLAEQLVFTSYIMKYLPFIIGVIGFIIAIVMYKTFQDVGG